jgi:hypothetical protein
MPTVVSRIAPIGWRVAPTRWLNPGYWIRAFSHPLACSGFSHSNSGS